MICYGGQLLAAWGHVCGICVAFLMTGISIAVDWDFDDELGFTIRDFDEEELHAKRNT